MRLDLSKKYVKGVGLEIAAFHNPWPAPGAHVIYLDCMTNPELRAKFPEMNHKPLVDVHVIDDAQYLKTIPDQSMDFVLSSHVFEHMESVAVSLKNWLRILKSGKCLVMAIPLKHNYIDQGRKPTTLEHVLKEYYDHPRYDYEGHYREYFTDSVDQLKGDQLEETVKKCIELKSNIHFHCWDFLGLKILFQKLKDLFKYEVMEIHEVGHEAFVVLRKG